MSRLYIICCGFLTALSTIVQLASVSGALLARTLEQVWRDAFPVEAPALPTEAAQPAARVIGLVETRAYAARRLQREPRQLSVGLGACLAA